MDEKKQQSKKHDWHFESNPAVASSSRSKIQAGDICPRCQHERIDYNGMLNLVCPNCGQIEGGCFT
ncbi:MAG: hypothetical protein JEZ00_04035 [Anaerolineaceae bacterium]|nr:hypothetical protein [Anaerolineaceae bacterium]